MRDRLAANSKCSLRLREAFERLAHMPSTAIDLRDRIWWWARFIYHGRLGNDASAPLSKPHLSAVTGAFRLAARKKPDPDTSFHK